MTLTIEVQKGGNPEAVLCFDRDGLELLIKKLEYLKSHVDHLHLMTPSWAGNELTEEPCGGSDYQLLHSLRLVRLSDIPPSI